MKFMFAPGDRPLAGFTIKRAIHRGGFGEVYYAQTDAGKEVALKLLHHNEEVELRGVRQCLNLKHPQLVTLFDIRTDADGDAWIVMEYITGSTLAERLRQHPRGLPQAEIELLVDQLCRGLTFLHERNLVHRDLKPANIFFEGEQLKIGDVGLSKFIGPSRRSAQTQSVGTVHYMAPEIAQGQYGPGVDLYALGVIVFEVLTGELPFDGESTGEILLKHLTQPPDLERVEPRFRSFLQTALQKEEHKRFASAEAFRLAFQAACHSTARSGAQGSQGTGPVTAIPVSDAAASANPASQPQAGPRVLVQPTWEQQTPPAKSRAKGRKWGGGCGPWFPFAVDNKKSGFARPCVPWGCGTHKTKTKRKATGSRESTAAPGAAKQRLRTGNSQGLGFTPGSGSGWWIFGGVMMLIFALRHLRHGVPFSTVIVAGGLMLGAVVCFRKSRLQTPSVERAGALPQKPAPPVRQFVPGAKRGSSVLPQGRMLTIGILQGLTLIPLLSLLIAGSVLFLSRDFFASNWNSAMTDWGHVGFFIGTTALGSALLLLLTSWREQRTSQSPPQTQRLPFVIAGSVVGLLVFGMSEWFGVHYPEQIFSRKSDRAITHLGRHELAHAKPTGLPPLSTWEWADNWKLAHESVTRVPHDETTSPARKPVNQAQLIVHAPRSTSEVDGLSTSTWSPTLVGYMVFFSLLFSLRNWQKLVAFRRYDRFRWTSIAGTALVAYLICLFLPFPMAWGMTWAAAITGILQLSAPWKGSVRYNNPNFS